MNPLDLLHGRLVFGRRVERLAGALADRLPGNASVLDIGCGDGSIAHAVQQRRSDLTIAGVDVLVRPAARIPVTGYDGSVLPFPDGAFDAACLVDVLHHTDDPGQLLREAARVASSVVVVKDHLVQGRLAEPTLRAMDWVGNARHGVRLPYNYLSVEQWRQHLRGAGLAVRRWDTDIPLYAKPLSTVFGRDLHVVMTLEPRRGPLRAAAGACG